MVTNLPIVNTLSKSHGIVQDNFQSRLIDIVFLTSNSTHHCYGNISQDKLTKNTNFLPEGVKENLFNVTFKIVEAYHVFFNN